MFSVEAIRQRQEVMKDKSETLLEHFLPFRESVITGLKDFILEAKENKILGIEQQELVEFEDHVEFNFELNEILLVLVSINGVALESLGNDLLTAKIFLFFEGNNTRPPYIEIGFQKLNQEDYVYYIKVFGEEREHWLKGKTVVNTASGKTISELLIEDIYGFQSAWISYPTLDALRASKTVDGRIGFHTLQKKVRR